VKPGRVPVAALVLVALVVVVEVVATAKQPWFADASSWHWQTKRALLDEGALNGDVAIFGTSVLFYGLDPSAANRAGGSGRVVNLALGGMTLPHQVQLFRERATSSDPPRVAVLEFRELVVTPDSWFSWPYFRFWARWPDVLESRFYYWDLPIALSYVENRASMVFRQRQSLSRWLVESARTRRPVTRVYERNRSIAVEMREHSGWSRQPAEDTAFESVQSRPRPWNVNAGGDRWVRYFMQTAAAHGIRVVLLLPPAPPPPRIVELPGPDGFRARFTAHVSRLRAEFPAVPIEVFEPTGFALEDFGDEIHLTVKGREKMSAGFAAWVSAYRARNNLQ
jgi:hypothetical protein